MRRDNVEEEIGYTVDITDLLFTPERNFLVKNNGHKVMVDDLKGKTVVLYIVPLYEFCLDRKYTLDIIQAYDELLTLGGVEFVFVPAYIHEYRNDDGPHQEAIFTDLFSVMPFPAVPFSDVEACGDRVVKTFLVADSFPRWPDHLPYWVVIDPTSRVVAGRLSYPYLFKLFGGAELHPLSLERIQTLQDEHECKRGRWGSRTRLFDKWDQLLASPHRDYLLSSRGRQVPISSLKGRVIGLYFCENEAHPPRMEMIDKMYRDVISSGYDFEIVQINFHYHFFRSHVSANVDMSVQHCNKYVCWLTLPFKDPSCRKLQRVFKCDDDYMSEGNRWPGDCLVVINPHQSDNDRVLFEFSGAEIFQRYGIEAYPFTRQYLYKIEYGIQENEMKLQSFFPHRLLRPVGRRFGFGGSQLTGKRVLVLFANGRQCRSSAFVSMLKSKYYEHRWNKGREDKFEVVYVSTDDNIYCFNECIKDMPWLVFPYSRDLQTRCVSRVMKICEGVGAAAFDKDGRLIAKECELDGTRSETSEYHKRSFPFISLDLKRRIRMEVGWMCRLHHYD